MILSLFFAFMADACCAKKATAYYKKYGKHCCGKCKARASQNKSGKKELKPTQAHVDESNHITRVMHQVKAHHSRKKHHRLKNTGKNIKHKKKM